MKSNSIVRQYGLIIGLVCIIMYTISIYFPEEQWINTSLIGIYAIGIILECIAFRKSQTEPYKFSTVFSSGFFTGLIAVALLLLMVVLYSFLFPEIKESFLINLKKELANNSGLTDAQREQAYTMTSKLYLVFLLVGTTFWGLLSTVLGSFLGALFAKNVKPSNTQELTN